MLCNNAHTADIRVHKPWVISSCCDIGSQSDCFFYAQSTLHIAEVQVVAVRFGRVYYEKMGWEGRNYKESLWIAVQTQVINKTPPDRHSTAATYLQDCSNSSRRSLLHRIWGWNFAQRCERMWAGNNRNELPGFTLPNLDAHGCGRFFAAITWRWSRDQ